MNILALQAHRAISDFDFSFLHVIPHVNVNQFSGVAHYKISMKKKITSRKKESITRLLVWKTCLTLKAEFYVNN